MINWSIILGVLLGFEVFTILTGEKYYPTLSRTIWKLLGLEDRGYDRHEVFIRIITTIVLVIFFGWVVIHLAWGPCAFNIC